MEQLCERGYSLIQTVGGDAVGFDIGKVGY